ncbi:MAG: hypothetical protein ISS26_00145 [Candidatus Omnitrophica bacterium]|nr:hypothetical protein [Candidatus Omnitrophota bacterium]
MQRIVKMLIPVILMSFFAVGCGGRVSETRPIPEIKTEAQAMSVNQLKAIIAKYEQAIQLKKAEIAKLTERIKQIPIADMLGEESNKIKVDIKSMSTSIRALMDRLNVYSQELSKKL